MPIPRNVYSLNTKVENPTYNPSLSRNPHCISACSAELRVRCGSSAGGFTGFISTCESVTRCQVLFEVTARERRSFRFQSSMKDNQKDCQKNPKNGVFPHQSKPDFHRATYSALELNSRVAALPSSAPCSGAQIGQNCLFSQPLALVGGGGKEVHAFAFGRIDASTPGREKSKSRGSWRCSSELPTAQVWEVELLQLNSFCS